MKLLSLLLSTFILAVSADRVYEQVEFQGTSSYLKKPFGKLSTFYPNASVVAGSPLPTLMFYTGFGSNFPAGVYTDLLEQLSQKLQMIVVCWDGTFKSNPLDHSSQLRRASTIRNYLLDGNFTKDTGVVVDAERMFYGGHSSGNQLAIIMSLQYTSKALVLLDPVDADPFGLIKQVIPPPPQTINYTNPVLVIWAKRSELRGAKVGNILPICSPPGHNAINFYEAFSNKNAKFMLEATDYGHNDFFNDNWASISHNTKLCGSVIDTVANPFEKYRGYVTGSVKMFIDAVMGVDCNQNAGKLLKVGNVNSKIVSSGNLCN